MPTMDCGDLILSRYQAAGAPQPKTKDSQCFPTLRWDRNRPISSAAMKSILETIHAGAQYLEKRGVSEARRNMEYLLAHSLGCGRMELYTRFERPLAETELAPLRELLKKRGTGIPLQHLLGTVPFHGRDFICDGRGLIPRPETEELVEMILENLPGGSLDILDMGCGSGVLGLTLAAERPESRATLADVSEDAISLAQENSEKLGIGNARMIQSDLFGNISGTFDLIAANLPYVPDGDGAGMDRELSHDPALALFSGSDGLDLLKRFIPESVPFLKPGGMLALEIGYNQASQVRLCLEKSCFTEIGIRKDLSGIARFPFAKHL